MFIISVHSACNSLHSEQLSMLLLLSADFSNFKKKIF